jgi:hypothetical protein
MSRSGYSDDCEHLALWRGAVERAIAGRRGQAFLHELIEALDAMPEKLLIKGQLQASSGEVCAIGAVGIKRGVELAGMDPYDYDRLSSTFGIARALVQEIEFENDEGGDCGLDTPEARWQRMRDWVASKLRTPA